MGACCHQNATNRSPGEPPRKGPKTDHNKVAQRLQQMLPSLTPHYNFVVTNGGMCFFWDLGPLRPPGSPIIPKTEQTNKTTTPEPQTLILKISNNNNNYLNKYSPKHVQTIRKALPPFLLAIDGNLFGSLSSPGEAVLHTGSVPNGGRAVIPPKGIQ